MFSFFQKLPSGISNEPVEKASKALTTLIIMTGLLAVMFAPVFSSYNSDEAVKIVELKVLFHLQVLKFLNLNMNWFN